MSVCPSVRLSVFPYLCVNDFCCTTKIVRILLLLLLLSLIFSLYAPLPLPLYLSLSYYTYSIQLRYENEFAMTHIFRSCKQTWPEKKRNGNKNCRRLFVNNKITAKTKTTEPSSALTLAGNVAVGRSVLVERQNPHKHGYNTSSIHQSFIGAAGAAAWRHTTSITTILHITNHNNHYPQQRSQIHPWFHWVPTQCTAKCC